MLAMWKVRSHCHKLLPSVQGFTTTNNSNTLHKFGNNNNTQMQAMFASLSTTNDEVWFFDTRTTHHLTQDVGALSNIQPYKGKDQVTVNYGKQIPILNVGTKSFPSTLKVFHLKKVFHVLHLTTNLISVSKFCTDNDTFFEFHLNFFLVRD